MTLMPFSIPEHVPLLRKGKKLQTTRLNGLRKYPYKVGDTLHCYYKVRMKKSCANCIHIECAENRARDSICKNHSSLIGNATVIDVIPLKTALHDPEEFARLDGFKNFAEADKWFRATSGVGANWVDMPYQVIRFRPEWIQEAE